MQATTVERPKLNAQDRCDRCGAQAKTVASKGKLEILFCDHHTNKYREQLTKQGWQLIKAS
jgi:hypothetical protein